MSEFVAVAAKWAGCLKSRRSKRYNLAKVQARVSALKAQDTWVTVHNVKSYSDGGILDPDDQLNDVVDDREQIIAVFEEQSSPCPTHNAGDGTSASSVGTESPDMFHCNELHHNGMGKGTSSYVDVEITGDKLPLGVAPLQVRRGSEPTLNRLSPRLSPVSSEPDPTKRWSAAVVVDDVSLSRGIKENGSHSDGEHPSSPGERGDGSGEEKSALSRISRGSGRLSILGNNPTMLRWAEAADRQLYKFQDSRKDPLGSAGSSPDRDSEVSGGSDERDNVVVLKNEAGPLGIHVVPEQGTGGRDMGLVIQGIEPGGRIDRDGRLQVGDTIVEVNGRSLLHLSFQDAQQVFKEALRAPEVCLHLSRRRRPRLASPSGPCPSPPPPLPTSPPPLPPGGRLGGSPIPCRSPPRRPPPPACRKTAEADGMHNGTVASTNGLVEGEERAGLNSKVATVTPTKKLPPPPPAPPPPPPPAATPNNRVAASTCLSVANTRKMGRKVHMKLVKGPQGLGFSVTTRDNPAGGNCPIYIKNILPKGAAIDDGRLRPGDRLLEVNGIEMTGRTQTEAVSILRNAPPGSTVELVVSRQEPDPSPSPGLPRELPPEKAGDEVGIFPWRQKEIVTLDIPLNDTGSAGLGVSVKGKTSTGPSGPVDLGIFVKSVIHGGAASKDGRLRTNDQLLNINGTSLLGVTNSHAMETLRRAMTQGEGPNPNAITLTVARRVPSQDVAENLRFEEGFLSSGDSFSVHLRSDSLLSSDSNAASSSCENLSVSGGSGNGRTPDHSTSGNSENTVVYLPSKQQQQQFPIQTHDYGYGRNPVLDRLMGQGPGTLPGSLRNESYLRASHESWMADRQMGRHHVAGPHPRPAPLSPNVTRGSGEAVHIDDDYPSIARGSGDAAPPMTPVQEEEPQLMRLLQESNDLNQSELSLVDGGNFCRDGFGRQSISEKRHAHLDARNTDTYKRNKKSREEQEKVTSFTRPEQQQTEVKTSISPPTLNGGPHHYDAPPNNRRPNALNGKEQQSSNLVRSNSADSLLGHSRPQGPTESGFMMNGDSPSTDASCATYNTTVTKSNNSSGNNTGNGTTQLGPSLGMRKSSSLESLQTLVQGAGDGPGSGGNGGRQERGARGCNESFRAAVDRSYEGPPTAPPTADQMETLEEEKESETGSSASAEHRVPSHPNTVASTLDPQEVAAYKKGTAKPVQRKKGLLKGLGSVFSRFGKNRKTIPEPGSKLSREEMEQEAERLRARQAAREEQERIQEQYRKLVDQQHQQQQQHQHQQPHQFQHPQQQQHQRSQPLPPLPVSPPPCGPNGTPSTRQERMQQLRAQHQKRHVERQGHYPRDDLEEWYEQDLQHKMRSPLPPRRESDVVHSRSQSFDIFKEMERPGSRVGLADPTQYSHYVNFNEIQLHLRQFQQKQQQQQKQGPRPPPPPMPSRPRPERPSSNYFEYESIQVQLPKQHKEKNGTGGGGGTDSSSLPRHAHIAGHRMVYAKTVATTLPHGASISGNANSVGTLIKTVPTAAPRAHPQTVPGYRHSPNNLSQGYSVAPRRDHHQMPGSKV